MYESRWVEDLLKPYVWPTAPEIVQFLFGKLMGFIALCIGISLAILSIQRGKPDLSGLFSLQNVTPIHVSGSCCHAWAMYFQLYPTQKKVVRTLVNCSCPLVS